MQLRGWTAGVYTASLWSGWEMLDRIPLPVGELKVDRNCTWFGRQQLFRAEAITDYYRIEDYSLKVILVQCSKKKPTAKWIIAPYPTLLPNCWSYWPRTAPAQYSSVDTDIEIRASSDCLMASICSPTSAAWHTSLLKLVGDASNLPTPLLNLCFPRSFHNFIRPNSCNKS